MHGRWPTEEIDHINNNRSDNRIANLREASRSQNCGNQTVRRNSKTGIKGVMHDPSKFPLRPWLAQIGGGRKVKVLGWFETSAEASAAYQAAALDRWGAYAKF